MRREQRIPDSSAEFVDIRIRSKTAQVEEHFSRQRVAVGVQPGRRQSDEHVSGRDRLAIDELRPLHGPDDEAGDVVLAVSIETGHLRCLTADERAAVLAARACDAGHNLFGDVRRQPAGGQVVEKEERARRPGRGCR